MKPAPFEYHAPETVDEVCALLAEYGDEAKVLAGGQSLVPMLALRLTRFEHLVDVNRVGALAGFGRENGTLVVQAATRQRVMERDAAIAAAVPLLARATPLIGHFQIRNRGTVGGSLAHADPASEYPAVAVALGAELELAGPGGAAPAGRRRRLLRRHVDDRGRARRAAGRGPVPGVAGAQRLRDRGGRAPPRRFRARGRGVRGDRRARRASRCSAWARRRCGRARPRRRSLAGAAPADVAAAAVAELDPSADVHASAVDAPCASRAISSNARSTRAQEDLRAAG